MGAPRPNTPYRNVAQLLREHIELGFYPPGERMPSLPQLGALYGVKSCVVRNALAVLRDEGIIAARSGDGHYVIPAAERGDPAATQSLRETTHAAVLRSGVNLTEVSRRVGVSRWHVTRMLTGKRPLTRFWSERIIDAVTEDETDGA